MFTVGVAVVRKPLPALSQPLDLLHSNIPLMEYRCCLSCAALNKETRVYITALNKAAFYGQFFSYPFNLFLLILVNPLKIKHIHFIMTQFHSPCNSL